MERLTPQKRLQIIQLYYANERSVRNVYRALRATYGSHNRPSERTIANTIRKLESQYTLLDDTRPIRPRSARSEQNIAAVADSVAENRDQSVRRRAQHLGLTYATTWRILHEDLCDVVPGGRPSEDPKEVKPPSGRERPLKRRNVAKATDDEDNALNGVGDPSTTAKKGKASKQILATGKGRGRLKIPPKSDEDDKEEEKNDEEGGDDDGED